MTMLAANWSLPSFLQTDEFKLWAEGPNVAPPPPKKRIFHTLATIFVPPIINV